MIALVSVNYLAYKNALKQAWKDGKMSADESAMLDTLRKSLNISAEEHLKIEKDVRSELADIVPEMNEQYEVAAEPAPSMNQNPGLDQHELGQQSENMQPPAPSNTSDTLESEDINVLLNEGKNSYHKGNYEGAIEFCDKVLLLDPDNSEALFFRKRTLSKIEKLHGGKDEPEKTAAKAEPEKTAAKAEPEQLAAKAEPELEPPEVSPEPGGTAAGGKGDPDCKSCKGSGQCHWCRGSGECYWCKGTGKCDKCDGSGKIGDEECKSCKGSGKCHSCNGDSKCYWCNGTGKCSKCSL